MRALAQGDGVAGIKHASGEQHDVAAIEGQRSKIQQVAARGDQPDAEEGHDHARDLQARDGRPLEQRRADQHQRRNRALQQGDVDGAGPIAGEIEQDVEAGIAAERHQHDETPALAQGGQIGADPAAQQRKQDGADDQPAQRHHGHGRNLAHRRAADHAIGPPHRGRQHQQHHGAIVEETPDTAEIRSQSSAFFNSRGIGDHGRDFCAGPALRVCKFGAKLLRRRNAAVFRASCDRGPMPQFS